MHCIRHRVGTIVALFVGAIAFGSAPTSNAQDVLPEALGELIPEEGFELPKPQLERLRKYLPNAMAKLERRQPVHLIALGDSVTRYVSYDEHDGDAHKSYVGVFTAELARLFFYTGGVRDLYPPKGLKPKPVHSEGPEITIEKMALSGRISLHALARLTTDAFINQPSILTISYGINDDLSGLDIATYLRAFERSAELARANRCDPIFLAPTTILDRGTNLFRHASTRPYASALEDLANKLDVLYVDCGYFTSSATAPDGSLPVGEILTGYNQYRAVKYHTHTGGKVDELHPNEATHKSLGKAVYETLLKGAPEPTYRIGGRVTLNPSGSLALQFKLKNLDGEDKAGHVFLEEAGDFVPDSATIPFELRAGKGKEFGVSFSPKAKDGLFRFDGSESVLRLPVMVVDSSGFTPLTIRAQVAPLMPKWNLGGADGLRESVGGEFSIVAPGADVAGAYRVLWNNNTSSGNFQSSAPIGFSFPIPKEQFRVRDDLILELDHDGATYRFMRGFEVSQNMGLDREVELTNIENYSPSRSGVKGSPGVRFKASADESGLYLTCDLQLPLKAALSKAPYYLEYQFDARSYGKRRTPGFVDFVRLTPQPDGSIKIGDLRPAVFGEGYSKRLDRSALQPTTEPLPGGGQRMSLKIPRAFFYLHEWALGNGNSLLGMQLRAYAMTNNSSANNPYPADGRYQLIASGVSQFDAESLAVLELTPTPTQRWSARLY